MLSADVKSPEGKTPHLNAAEIDFIPYVQWLTMFKIIEEPYLTSHLKHGNGKSRICG